MKWDWYSNKILSIIRNRQDLKKLKKKLENQQTPPQSQPLSPEEVRIVSKIEEETKLHNKDNLTRTKAYLTFYKEHPTIHWSLLAHMVSRNAGWNMTDLKGDLLSRLLSIEDQEHYFHLIERGNWLIFQDAYPQLLLAKESYKQKKNLFHLLPSFGVSSFMKKNWDFFWDKKNSYLLTVALIINEQNYIEERVIKKDYYQESVLHTLAFALQDFFDANHILFPYQGVDKLQLSGKTVSNFTSLPDRISLGKKLYDLLFHSTCASKIQQWAIRTPHTASRSDFAPDLFQSIDRSEDPYKMRLEDDCKIVYGLTRLYSPPLKDAWNLISHEPAKQGDWYTGSTIINFYSFEKEKGLTDMNRTYCNTLKQLELAVIGKEYL